MIKYYYYKLRVWFCIRKMKLLGWWHGLKPLNYSDEAIIAGFIELRKLEERIKPIADQYNISPGKLIILCGDINYDDTLEEVKEKAARKLQPMV